MAERSHGSGRCRPWSSGIRISPSSPCSSTRRRGPSVSCEGPRAESAVTLDPRWLSAVPPGELARLKLRLHPSLSLLESPWPIDQIWRANQPGADPEATVSLDAGAVRLEICRLEDCVVFRPMTPGTYAFERAFATGLDLRR